MLFPTEMSLINVLVLSRVPFFFMVPTFHLGVPFKSYVAFSSLFLIYFCHIRLAWELVLSRVPIFDGTYVSFGSAIQIVCCVFLFCF